MFVSRKGVLSTAGRGPREGDGDNQKRGLQLFALTGLIDCPSTRLCLFWLCSVFCCCVFCLFFRDSYTFPSRGGFHGNRYGFPYRLVPSNFRSISPFRSVSQKVTPIHTVPQRQLPASIVLQQLQAPGSRRVRTVGTQTQPKP